MKKIVLLYDFLKELGGLERVMFFQAETLKKKYEVELHFIYVSQKEKETITKAFGLDPSIKIVQLSPFKSEFFSYVYALLFPQKLIPKKADLLISSSLMTDRIAQQQFTRYKNPYICVLHHPPNYIYNRSLAWVNSVSRFFAYALGFGFGPILKKIDLQSVRSSQAIIGNSEHTVRRLEKVYSKKAVLLYPPLGKEFVLPSRKEVLNFLARKNIPKEYCLMHGRMIKDKKPEWGILAFEKSRAKTLVISGTIEDPKKIRAMIQKMPSNKKVILLGRVTTEDLPLLYAGASCFLVTAPKEDFGLTPIEAIACGCPVIVWGDACGPHETVLKTNFGFIAKPYSLESFTDQINTALLKTKSNVDLLRVISPYTQKTIGKKLLSLVEKII